MMANDGLLNYITVTTVPGEFIVNRSYNVNKQMEYIGYAEKGTTNTQGRWVIRKYTYTDNQITSERIAKNAVWNDRTSLNYD